MVKELEQVLKESVKKQLKGVKRPYALLLSGGVDSSLLATWTKPDLLITCKFPYGKKYDEFKYSKKTAEHLKIKQVVVEFTEQAFHYYLPKALKHYKPTTHFSLVPLYMLFRRASELGIKTILSAEGPDEYLGGYTAYNFMTHEQELYNQEEMQNYHPALDKYLGSPMERFARILGKEPEELKKYWDKYDNLLSKMGYVDLQLRGIEDMELAMAKAWGINLIYPYMTEEVEKFCFKQVPDKMKIKGFTTKWILKKIAEKYLPKEVVWRKNKMGGPVAPIGKWLGEKDEFCKDKYLKLQEEIWKKSQ